MTRIVAAVGQHVTGKKHWLEAESIIIQTLREYIDHTDTVYVTNGGGVVPVVSARYAKERRLSVWYERASSSLKTIESMAEKADIAFVFGDNDWVDQMETIFDEAGVHVHRVSL